MADPTFRRLKQIEKRLDKVDPRRRPGNVLHVDREQYERALALTRLPYRPPPSQMPIEPVKIWKTPRTPMSDRPEENPNAVRLRRLRDLSNATDGKSKLIW